MMRHFSHIFLALGLTFIVVIVSPRAAASGARITHKGWLRGPDDGRGIATSSAVRLLQDQPAHTPKGPQEGPDEEE